MFHRILDDAQDRRCRRHPTSGKNLAEIGFDRRRQPRWPVRSEPPRPSVVIQPFQGLNLETRRR